jgi:hypothetical protein
MNRRERTLSPESSRCRRLVPPVDHRSGGNYDNYDDDDDDERIVIAMRGREEEEEEEEDKRSGRTAFRYRATSENRRRRLARLVGRNKSLPRDCDDDDDYRVVGYGYEANDEDGGSGGSSRDGRDSIFSADDNVIGTDEEVSAQIRSCRLLLHRLGGFLVHDTRISIASSNLVRRDKALVDSDSFFVLLFIISFFFIHLSIDHRPLPPPPPPPPPLERHLSLSPPPSSPLPLRRTLRYPTWGVVASNTRIRG